MGECPYFRGVRMKKIIAGIIVVVVICLVLVMLAPFFVNLDRYKGTILAQIKPYLDRDVDFAHIELTILSGLGAELEGLRVADNPRFSSADFVSLDSLQVQVEFFPLLKKEIKVKKIVLKRPVISVARNTAGEFSFDDILASLKKKGNTSGTPSTRHIESSVAWAAGDASDTGASKSAAPPLSVRELQIVDGRVLYRDDMLLPGAGNLVVDALDLIMEDVSFDRPVSVDLSADLFESGAENFSIKGTLGPLGAPVDMQNMQISVDLGVKSFPLARISALLPAAVQSGAVTADIKGKGSLGDILTADTVISVRDLVFQEKAEKKAPVPSGKIDAGLKANLSLAWVKQHLSVKPAVITVNENSINLSGTVDGFLAGPKWNITGTAEKLMPKTLIALLAPYIGAMPEALVLDGPVSLRFASSGSVSDFAVDAGINADAMNLAYGDAFKKPPGTVLSLDIAGIKKGRDLSFEKIDCRLHNLVAHATGKVRTGKPGPSVDVTLETGGTELDGWGSLVPAMEAYALNGAIALNASAKGTPDNLSLNVRAESGRIGFQLPPAKDTKNPPNTCLIEGVKLNVDGTRKKDLLGRGTLVIGKGTVASVPFAAAKSDFSYRPGRVTIDSLSMKAFEGSVQGTGFYDILEKVWAFDPSIQRVDVGTVLDTLTEHKDTFAGTLSGKFHAEGGAARQPKLGARGSVLLAKGEWKNFNLVESVLDSLFGLEGVGRFLSYQGGEVARHESTRFDSLDGTFDMKDNIIRVESLNLRNIQTSKATDSVALLKGTVDRAAKTLDLKGTVILSKRHSLQLVEKADILRALLNNQGNMVLPITLKGSIKKPIPFLDTEYVLNALSSYYMQKGAQKLLEKLF